jgi:RimK family alpha-L-glutamate ligase
MEKRSISMEQTAVKRKKAGIIYDGRGNESWDISYFKKLFEKKGMDVLLFDANGLDDAYSTFERGSVPELLEMSGVVRQGYSIWMNRVYPSEADRSTINKSLNLVYWLNQNGFLTINPLTACQADYDKYLSYELMQSAGVPTPRTEKITSNTSLEQIADNFSFPLIVKRNTGGKGIGVMRIGNEKKLAKLLEDGDITSGRYLVQEFIEASRDHDIRVGVIDGEPLISYGRTLVKRNGEKPWMGSCHYGSQIIPYQASEEECRVAVSASEAIQARLNEVDIQITEEGPIVIENNPTPGYDRGEEHWIKLIVDHISDTY